MLGFNGGLLGTQRTPTASSAPGIWLPNEQSLATRLGRWPGAPGGDPFAGFVQLLVPMNVIGGSSTFVDVGPNTLALTPFGNAQISTAVFSVNGASGLFDGDGDFLRTAISSELSTAGDFAVDFWFYPLTLSGARVLLHIHAGGAQGLRVYTNNNELRVDNGLANDFISGNTEIQLRAWHHVGVSKSDGNLLIFRDGRLLSVRSAQDYGATDRIQAARYSSGGVVPDGHMHMSRLRFTRDVPRYGSAGFLPSDLPTQFLLRCEGENGSTAFVNEGVHGDVSVTAVNAVVSTALARFGGSSAFFNGTNAYLTANVPGGLGFSNFTLEWWMFPVGTSWAMFNSRTSGLGGDGMDFFASGSIGTANAIIISGGPTMIAGAWQHFAVVRDRGVLTRYVNGVVRGSGSSTQDFRGGTSFRIGGSPEGNVGFFHGYLDEIRFTRSAVYTGPFTPPVLPFPAPL